MNKLSGYKLFRLADGTEVELKFANATYELFAESMGLDTLEQVDAALTIPTKLDVDAEGKSVQVPQMTLAYLKAFRHYVLAAARYAALAQGKPADFTEWQVAEWIQELGYEAILSAMEKPATQTESEAKKKPKDRLKASQ